MAEKTKTVKAKKVKETAETKVEKKEVPAVAVKEVKAIGRYLRIAPKKVNRILKHIRRKSATEALVTLRFLPNSGARYIEKVLKSAMANAENNFKMSKDKLFIEKALVDSGVIMKRWRAGGRGRPAKIEKLTSHITIVLNSKEKK